MIPHSKHRTLSIVFIITAIVATGFLRDYIFYNIDAYINYLDWYHNNYCEPLVYAVISKLSISELEWLKWFLTFVFTDIWFLIGSTGLLLLYKAPQNLLRVLGLMYIGLFALSFMFYVFKLLSGLELGYEVARFFMHILQSPLPFLILIPASFLQEATKARND